MPTTLDTVDWPLTAAVRLTYEAVGVRDADSLGAGRPPTAAAGADTVAVYVTPAGCVAADAGSLAALQ